MEQSTDLPWFVNTAKHGWACEPPVEDAVRLHRRLPGYEPTPLVEMPALAAELGIARVFIKDESRRFDLGAFKYLGASWAVFRALVEHSGFAAETILDGGVGLDALREHLAAAGSPVTLVSATDGNHGRAVARMAATLGLPAVIFMPRAVPSLVVDRVVREGAEVSVLDTDYDGAIDAARSWAAEHEGAIVVQDTSWEGYEDVPSWIVEGYSTLFVEIDQQLAAAGAEHPTLVAVPIGVGSLAQAAIAHYRNTARDAPARVLGIEPDTAACVLQSLRLGRLESVPTGSTVMNGLNCGTPSTLAWPLLAGGLDAVIAVTDAECEQAMHDLARVGVESGPSGAAAFTGARRAALAEGVDAVALRAVLDLDESSILVCLSTEGPIR